MSRRLAIGVWVLSLTMDTARTLDEFSMRLRDEIDLEAVASELVAATHRTAQPAHAAVWLRERRP
jgi:hypothetical protein